MIFGFAIRALAGLVVVCALLGDAAASEEKRFALLIGNQAYDPSVGALKNPHNDVELVAAALKARGFEILPVVRDARRSAILAAVRDLAGRLRAAGAGAVGFLYYSGHGAAEKDTNINYIIPVDARDPGSVTFWDDSVKLDDIMRLLDQARDAVKFVVFDACRNELQLPTRDTSKGLLPVAEQQGFFVAYASAPGRTATDRGERSGPYAAALAGELGRQGLDHLNLFQNVKERVIASTGGVQQPWESNGLTRRVYLTGEPLTQADMALWVETTRNGDTASFRAYLTRFPDGLYAATARQLLERLEAEARQAEELQRALEDARQARVALEAARRDREAAAAREDELRRQSADRAQPPAAASAPPAQPSSDELARAEARRKEAEQKVAALQAAEQARAAAAAAAGAKVAALAKNDARPEPPRTLGTFDGTWSITATATQGTCMKAVGTFTVRVQGGAITAVRGGSGRVSAAGTVSWTQPALADGAPVEHVGRFSGNSGSGSFARTDNKCGGRFTARRG